MEYKLNTPKIKPSISDLLDLLNKPALISWANKIGLEGTKLKDFRKKSQGEGTSFHKQIEEFLRDWKPIEDVEFQKRVEAFFAGAEIIGLEKPFEHEFFNGRYDIKFSRNSETWICDFKTNKKKLYLENALQLVGYRMAEKCDRIGVISIPEMKLIEIPKEVNLEPYEQILIHLSHIYQLKKQTI